MKNLALFIDGTDNEGRAAHPENTNVYRLYEQVSQENQIVRYIEGIGRGEDAPASKKQRIFPYISKKIDLAFGRGATQRIKRAYLIVAENFENDDALFLFGFSRGAFIARMLAGFLDRVGKLLATHTEQRYIEYAFYLYWKDEAGHRFAEFLKEIQQRTQTQLEAGIPTHFLGQWDAVAALEPFGQPAASEARLLAIVKREQDQDVPTWIRHIRHALALHELRSAFEPMMWAGHDDATQTLQQAWFAGAHADVGGGYDVPPGTTSVFADAALNWMRSEAAAAGLTLAGQYANSMPIGATAPTNSYQNFYRLRPVQLRHPLLNPGSRQLASEFLHDSVLDRIWASIAPIHPAGDADVSNGWNSADCAAMQLHYHNCFPAAAFLPALSPQRLHQDFSRFCKAATGAEEISFDEMLGTLALIAIFGVEHTYTYLPKVTRMDWRAPLEEASKIIMKELIEPVEKYALYRHRRRIAYFENSLFRMIV
ncbi:T6SS phospholipase effector Tle1-like catalytic domain-containing protein [Pseudoduganella dura]|nr:DUF2235 domain-containing protein [Pseudoduganella dura]